MLCRDLDVKPWWELAYAGTPWKNNYLAPGEDGVCGEMEEMWKAWRSHSDEYSSLKMCATVTGHRGTGGCPCAVANG